MKFCEIRSIKDFETDNPLIENSVRSGKAFQLVCNHELPHEALGFIPPSEYD